MTTWLAGMKGTSARLNSPPVVAPMVTGSVSNSNAEVVIGTFTVPASLYPAAAGQGFEWKVAGTCGGTSSPTLTIRMRVVSTSGTIIASSAGTVNIAGGFFAVEGWMLFTAIGVSGLFNSLANVAENFTGVLASNVQAWDGTTGTAWNTTVSNPIYVTAQFSAANASNVAAGLVGNLYAQ